MVTPNPSYPFLSPSLAKDDGVASLGASAGGSCVPPKANQEGETPGFGGPGMSVLAGSAHAQASRPGAAGMLIVMFFCLLI